MNELMSGTYLLNIGTDLFALIILIVLYASDRNNMGQTYDMVLFSDIQILFMLCAGFDILSWLFDGVGGAGARSFVYIGNVCFMMLETLSLGIWFLFVNYRLHKAALNSTQKCWFSIPFIIIAILLILTPQYKIFFTVDINNFYHRTLWTDVMSLFQIGLLLTSSFNALKQRRREILPERRQECLTLSIFVVPILVAGLIQFFMYGVSFIIPFGALSILIVDLNLKGQRILQDPLTGLNNRGAMDRYMVMCDEDPRKRNSSFCVLMLDVDHFKKINDSYGHPIGDQALVVFAHALRQSCKDSKCFMCRYGGDEFLVIVEDISMDGVRLLKDKIGVSLLEKSHEYNLPFELQTSIGSSRTESLGDTSLTELMKMSDRDLYASKRLNRI